MLMLRTFLRQTGAQQVYLAIFVVVTCCSARGQGPVDLTAQATPVLANGALVSRIAFGSCVRQDKPQPIWGPIVAAKPDVFVFLGDNIYGDSEDPNVLRAKYEKLGSDPGFAALRKACPLLATWDDHDFGVNDGGAEYPQKVASQQLLLDFFGEPADSPRRKRQGLYDAKIVGPPGKRVQFILLDTRYHRGKLTKRDGMGKREQGRFGPYVPNPDTSQTMLGAEQWSWLEEQLRQPADLRIIASSIQVIAEEQCFEKWGNLPHERERLLKLIAETRAQGVIILSGDRHAAEISRLDGVVGYPLYDITSSALNQSLRWGNEVNSHRVGLKYYDANYGVIEIDWSAPDPAILLQIFDEQGRLLMEEPTTLGALRKKNQ